MARDENGISTLVSNSFNPAISGTVIDSEANNDIISDIESDLSGSLNRQGTAASEADQDMNGHHHLRCTPAEKPDQYLTAQQFSTSSPTWYGLEDDIEGGNLIKLHSDLIEKYKEGMLINFRKRNTNTADAVVMKINELPICNLVVNDFSPMLAGMLLAGVIYTCVYDGKNFVLLKTTQAVNRNDLFLNVFIGAIIDWSGTNFSQYCLLADGAVHKRSEYPDLWEYAQVSENFLDEDTIDNEGHYTKGDGSTTFRIPNISGGQFRRGIGGDADKTIGKLQQQAVVLPNHYHDYRYRGLKATGSGTNDPHTYETGNVLYQLRSNDSVSAHTYSLYGNNTNSVGSGKENRPINISYPVYIFSGKKVIIDATKKR